jgi:hypothetical protein
VLGSSIEYHVALRFLGDALLNIDNRRQRLDDFSCAVNALELDCQSVLKPELRNAEISASLTLGLLSCDVRKSKPHASEWGFFASDQSLHVTFLQSVLGYNVIFLESLHAQQQTSFLPSVFLRLLHRIRTGERAL